MVIGSVACTPLGMLIFGLFARLWFGAAFGALTGALGGLVVGFLPQEPPRRFTLAALLDPKARAGNPWAAVGFGAVGVAVGGLLGGLLYTPVDAVFAAVVAGTAFATARTATSPTVGKGKVTPTSSYASDRSAVLLSALVGAAAGALAGGVVAYTGASHARRLVVHGLSATGQGLLGAGVGLLLSGLGLGMMVFATSAWGNFATVRVWLWLHGWPFSVMRFLEDARNRGILRSSGPHYQFRHAYLHEQLARGDHLDGEES